jgi:hypothetical protein
MTCQARSTPHCDWAVKRTTSPSSPARTCGHIRRTILSAGRLIPSTTGENVSRTGRGLVVQHDLDHLVIEQGHHGEASAVGAQQLVEVQISGTQDGCEEPSVDRLGGEPGEEGGQRRAVDGLGRHHLREVGAGTALAGGLPDQGCAAATVGVAQGVTDPLLGEAGGDGGVQDRHEVSFGRCPPGTASGATRTRCGPASSTPLLGRAGCSG